MDYVTLAAASYVSRCRVAGDTRSARRLLEDILQGHDAKRIAAAVDEIEAAWLS